MVLMKHLERLYLCGVTMMMVGAIVANNSDLVQASALKSGTYDVTLQQGNEQADGFVTSQVTLKYKTAYSIFKELKARDVISSDVKVNSLEYKGEELVLDLSEEFVTDILSSGAA